MNITDVLARRTDLSTFLVHLTRASDGRSAMENLVSIIEDNLIEARTPFGAALHQLNKAGQPTTAQRCVCFTETPLEHVSLLSQPIDGRDIKFEPYGVAITRKQGRCEGVNPVWYLDMTPGHDWLTNSVHLIVEEAIKRGAYTDHPVARLTPFMDWMGVWESRRKEFWWEREWRHHGDFTLPPTYIVLAPEAEHQTLDMLVDALAPETTKVSFVDPAWSLEMIIGRLAGFETRELGPF
jgi:hypothetical protein